MALSNDRWLLAAVAAALAAGFAAGQARLLLAGGKAAPAPSLAPAAPPVVPQPADADEEEGSDDDNEDDGTASSAGEPDGPAPAHPTAAEVQAAQEAECYVDDSPHVPEDVELKMVACVRNDLAMSKGKIAAQCGHAFLGAYRVARRLPLGREWAKAWLSRACAKIALKVDSEAALYQIHEAAKAAGLPCMVIEDAGRTEVEPGTRTVLGIGPAPKALIDAITGPKGQFPLRLLA